MGRLLLAGCPPRHTRSERKSSRTGLGPRKVSWAIKRKKIFFSFRQRRNKDDQDVNTGGLCAALLLSGGQAHSWKFSWYNIWAGFEQSLSLTLRHTLIILVSHASLLIYS